MYDGDLLFERKNLTSSFCSMIPAISIVIPAYEEEERLSDPLRQIFAFVESEKLAAEVIVVDDGSRDKTSETAEKVCAEFPEISSKSSVTKKIAAKDLRSKPVFSPRMATLRSSRTPTFRRRLKRFTSSSNRLRTASLTSCSARARWTGH
jgi:glycosyltransferase involved in cell wall biosynthesis